MRLYVYDHELGEKIYLRNYARNRCELSCQLGGCKSIKVKGKIYPLEYVMAEEPSDFPIYLGMVLGAFFGTMIGPLGTAVGGLIGMLGGMSDKMYNMDRVKKFNDGCNG